MKKKDIVKSVLDGRQIMKDHKIDPHIMDFMKIAELAGDNKLLMYEMIYNAGVERGYSAAKKEMKRKSGKADKK